MRHQHAKARRKASSLGRPIRQQGRRRDHHARTRPASGRFAFKNQQQRQNLNRFAKAHIVSQTRAQLEPRQQIHPAHARQLIGPKFGAQCVAGAHLRERLVALGLSQRRERFRQPRPGCKLCPGVVCGALVLLKRHTRQQAHALGQLQFAIGRAPLNVLKARHQASERVGIHLHPMTTEHSQPRTRLQQCSNLRRAQRLAIQAHFHLKIKQ